jgi:hypothetical protein
VSLAIRSRLSGRVVQAHFLPDDTCDESGARSRIVEESTDAGPDRPVDASADRGRQGVGVGGPGIDARDLVASRGDSRQLEATALRPRRVARRIVCGAGAGPRAARRTSALDRRVDEDLVECRAPRPVGPGDTVFDEVMNQ